MNRTIGGWVCKVKGDHRGVARYLVPGEPSSDISLVCGRCGAVLVSFKEFKNRVDRYRDLLIKAES